MSGIYTINRRPGMLWAVLQFPVSRFLIASLVLLIVMLGGQLGSKVLHVASHSPAEVLVAILLATLTIAVYQLYVRVIERRQPSEYALPGFAAEFGRGFLIGILLFGCTMLILWLVGVAKISWGDGWLALGYQLMVIGVLPAIMEETLVRGVLFRMVEESLGSWWALVISAAVFGALHAFNPGATVISSIAIALEAGVLLAAAYMYTRRLWLPIGLHAAWNFTEGGVFGASVSGNKAYGLLKSTFNGSDWLTGGKFGPEASIVAIVVCLAAGIMFLKLAKQRNFIAPPVWRRGKAGA